MEKPYSRHFSVSAETQKLVREECKKEFLDHHPEWREVKITDNKIIREIALFYLEN